MTFRMVVGVFGLQRGQLRLQRIELRIERFRVGLAGLRGLPCRELLREDRLGEVLILLRAVQGLGGRFKLGGLPAQDIHVALKIFRELAAVFALESGEPSFLLVEFRLLLRELIIQEVDVPLVSPFGGFNVSLDEHRSNRRADLLSQLGLVVGHADRKSGQVLRLCVGHRRNRTHINRFAEFLDNVFHRQAVYIVRIQIQVADDRLEARRAQNLLLHGGQALIDVVHRDRRHRLHLWLLHQHQRLGQVFFRQNARGHESGDAAEHGQQSDEPEAPLDDGDDILCADFLMHHAGTLLFSIYRRVRTATSPTGPSARAKKHSTPCKP